MRFSQYKNIIEMLDSVIEATEYMRNRDSSELCSICAQTLQSVVRTVEAEQNGSDIISMMNTAIDCFENDVYESDDLYSLLSDIREKSISDIKFKVRVLFMAELGGKWDAMASVYYSMKKRDDCIVDVVLQPVFRKIKQSDGSEKMDIVYDDYLTPMGITHIPYQEYDMKTIRPDITFTSQPYESCTYPMFWPENIAKYSRLVYLPYFAATTFEKISTAYNSFFKLNTQKYSWKIPCQSNVMKDYYLKNSSHRGENVIVTGIPKWDFPMSLNKENTPLPNEWKSKLSGRKVFLWNTHFSVEICGSKLLSSQSAEFIKFFLNNQELGLIWRPHPMLETVIKVYHSKEEWDYYQKLKEIVKKSPNMVIDENGPYDVAFVWSDALISDFSTLMDQYIFMGKPILMLTLEEIDHVKAMFRKNNDLCDYSLLEFANTLDSQLKFIENVFNDKTESYITNQNRIRGKYFTLADGKCGERISDILISSLISEYQEPLRSTDILIFGSLDESSACIRLFEDNNYDYYLCDMYISKRDRKCKYIFSFDEIIDFSAKFYVVTDRDNGQFIKSILINNYGISEDKIMMFWKLYDLSIPNMLCDRLMINPLEKEYAGIILGISHTEVGLITNEFDEPFCNLSISSQDLYYQYYTLKYCYEHYKDKIDKLKYAIIDLYDYNYFNFDTSLSKRAIDYWCDGGYDKLEHNFSKNTNYSYNFNDVLSAIKRDKITDISQSVFENWATIFKDIMLYTEFEGFENKYNIKNRMKFVSDEQINNYDYNRGTVNRIHQSTIEENKKYFSKLLELLYKINPNIKIFTVVIPKYIETEMNDKMLYEKHLDYFNDIVSSMKKQYKFVHLDFKELTDISKHREYYMDAAHLNYYGAYKLTKMLNEYILSNDD